jgi:arginyl-tRNA synthetase
MKEVVEEALNKALKELSLSEALPEKVKIEKPKNPSHGDLATNLAFLLSKEKGKSPQELALLLSEKLSENSQFSEVSPAGGFINFRFSRDFLLEEFRKVLLKGEEYFREDLGKGRKVQIEFVSANPTGPLHLGHGRGAVVGDALSRLMSFFGYGVTREYYINDAEGRCIFWASPFTTDTLSYSEGISPGRSKRSLRGKGTGESTSLIWQGFLLP